MTNAGSENAIMIKAKMKILPPINSGNKNCGLFCEYIDKELDFLMHNFFGFMNLLFYLDYSVNTSRDREQWQNYCQTEIVDEYMCNN